MAKTVWKKSLASSNETWHLKKEDGSVEGPVKLAELLSWAMQGIVLPGQEVSEDKKTWRPVSELKELKMVWMVDSGDADSYGPVNILAIPHLVRQGIVPQSARLVNKASWKIVSVSEILKPSGSVRLVQKTAAPAPAEQDVPLAPVDSDSPSADAVPVLEIADDEGNVAEAVPLAAPEQLPQTKKIPVDTVSQRTCLFRRRTAFQDSV